MSLWDLIRDFYVHNIFGGTDSLTHEFSFYLGRFYHIESLDTSPLNTSNAMVQVGRIGDWDNDLVLNSISFGDWLSTTFTIITLILLVIFLYIFVKWIFKLFSGLLK